mmetsp:Transcript_118143/g.208940  ORF Transcript_118143/g.208940 Transcript_118143/m.208940 type:complete len:111 (+) Transcript_118143:875-1207(+)
MLPVASCTPEACVVMSGIAAAGSPMELPTCCDGEGDGGSTRLVGTVTVGVPAAVTVLPLPELGHSTGRPCGVPASAATCRLDTWGVPSPPEPGHSGGRAGVDVPVSATAG